MTLLTKILDKIIKKKLLYVRLSKNAIEIKEIQTGKSISRKAPVHYSNKRSPPTNHILHATKNLLNFADKKCMMNLQEKMFAEVKVGWILENLR